MPSLLHCLTHSTLGGGQEVVYTLVDVLQRRYRELRIGVVLPAGGVYVERFRALGVTVAEAPLDTLGLRGVALFRQATASFGPQIIHSHGKGAGLFARTLTPGIPHVHSYHGFFPPRRAGRLYVKAEEVLLRKTAAVVSVSEGEAEELRRVFPQHAGKVFAIPNVVDRTRVLAAGYAPLPDELREFFFRHRDGVIVTMVARDDPAKNYPLATDACSLALANDRRLAVVFVGVQETGGVSRLREKFPERVLAIPRLDSVAPVLMASSMVLLTSVKEGGRPMVLQEALALGKPVVATDVPGIRETVRDGWNGLLCAMEPSSVAGAILRLASSSEERAAFGERAAIGSAAESLEAWADRYAEVYMAALERSPHTAGGV